MPRFQTKPLIATLVFGLGTLTPHWLISSPPAQAATCTRTVTNTSNSGAGSLRQAITDSNTASDADVICFNIGAGGLQTISPTAQLPAITQPATIDGTTQPTFSGTPLIEINGQNAGSVPGIWITAGTSTIKGLIINRFGANGIFITDHGTNAIQGNYIGTNATGTAAAPNGTDGIGIYRTTTNNVIGGLSTAARNVISGNSGNGIGITGGAATGNLIEGNYIGTNASGTGAIPNAADGVLINHAPNNLVGATTGTTPGGACTGGCNLISGNGYNGVGVWNDSSGEPGTAAGNQTMSNYVGVDVNGTAKLANANIGVELNESANNIVGGTTGAARNVLSGNLGAGVFITGGASTGNTVEGNYVGTNAAGDGVLANAKQGVGIGYSPGIQPAHHNTIGGTSGTTPGGACTGACNLISGNSQDGILISPSPGSNTFLGNYIGTNAAGAGGLGNAIDGIGIQDSPNNAFGDGTAAGRNIIASNQDNGVNVTGGASTGNRFNGNFVGETTTGGPLGNGAAGINVAAGVDTAILATSMFANQRMGIDLGYNNITQNDPGDSDDGPNHLQNFPNIYAARTNGSTTKIGGNFNSNASTAYLLEFYSSDGCNAGAPNNFGQGQNYLGSTSASTDVYGNTAFSFQPQSAVPGGKYITATATKKTNGVPSETSEFSQCILVNVSKPALTNGATWFLKYDLTNGPADRTFGYGFPSTLLMCAWGPNQPGVKLPVVVNGNTWFMRASYTTGTADLTFNYGFPGSTPVCGDWDGDGVDTPGIYTGTWFLRNTNNAGPADTTFAYGGSSGQPVVGDWDGNGTDTPGIFYPGNNAGWDLRNSNTAGAPDVSFNYGGAGATPIIGDWNGDGTDTIGVTYGSLWNLRNANTSGPANVAFQYGFSGVKALVW